MGIERYLLLVVFFLVKYSFKQSTLKGKLQPWTVLIRGFGWLEGKVSYLINTS